MLKKLKIMWNFMKGNRLLYFGAIISIGLATLMAVLGPLVIRITIDFIIGNKSISIPLWVQSIMNGIGGKSVLAQNLWICGSALVLLTIVNGLFSYLKGKWSAVASESIAKNIREMLYDHLQRLTYDYHIKAKTGDLIQRCTSDIETVRSFLAVQFVEIGRAIFMVMFVSIIMFSLNVKLALVSMTVIPIIFTFGLIFFTKVKDAFLLSDESEARLSTVLQENLTGMRVVRAFARQKYEIDKYDEKNVEFRDLTYKLIRLLALYWSSSDCLCMLQVGGILVAGAYWASIGEISLGTLVVFTTYEGMLLWPVRQLGKILTDMAKSLVSITRIQEIFDEPVELMEEKNLKPAINGEIEFKDVCFEYDKGRPVLSNISFKALKGQTVAILGPTGSGKTSLVHLIPRLYDYKSGSIKIDGIELKTIDKRWIRHNVGIVAQETFLFSKTIKENIGFAKLNIKDDEVFEAAGIAAVHNTILEFEKAYDTAVGERGVTLSGGQKQRIAIARTIITDYPILIFDDSLSAVDTETDAAIRRALKDRSLDVTTFIISHRITTLSEADIIIVLDKGEIIQMGKHDELIIQDGLYRRIWSIQNTLEQDIEYETRVVDSSFNKSLSQGVL